MKKVLITGGSGLLGKALQNSLPKGYESEATWYTNGAPGLTAQMDVQSRSQIAYVFSKVKPDIVIHCAANGSVDYTEKNYDLAYNVNVTGTQNVLDSATEIGAKFVYISSNAVFSGDNPPYDESRNRRPVNKYGLIKCHAEDIVTRQGFVPWLIIRPFLLYGWPRVGGRSNWAKLVFDNLSRGDSLKLVSDVMWQPTYDMDCANAIWQLIEEENQVYHVATDDKVSLYEFGLQAAKTFELDHNLIEPVPASFFSALAPRPIDTTFDLSKLKGRAITLNSIAGGLQLMRGEIEAKK